LLGDVLGSVLFGAAATVVLARVCGHYKELVYNVGR
jgi:hypothetical protein